MTLSALDVRSRQEWRSWLQDHHGSESGIWLVFHKGRTGERGISYEAAVEEALCFGWIDSLVKRLDDNRYARKFTPRKPDSRWSTLNRQRYAKLEQSGLLAQPGRERPPTARSGDGPRVTEATLPHYIEAQLRASPRAWKTFEHLAPSHRRRYIAWIDFAKREETKQKRLHEAIHLLEAGQKLGLK